MHGQTYQPAPLVWLVYEMLLSQRISNSDQFLLSLLSIG